MASNMGPGTIPQRGYERPYLKYLNRHVIQTIAHVWYELGIELMEPKDETYLNALQEKYDTDINKGSSKMIDLWLKRQPQASWNQLIEALRRPHIRLEHAATEIEKMLQPEVIDIKNEPVPTIVDMVSEEPGEEEMVLKQNALKETSKSEMDNETYLSKAKQENQVINIQHIKILLTGSAAAGKTSFCRLLFRSKYSSEYNSTEIAEFKQGISVVNFSMLKEETNKKIVWLKLDPKSQIAQFKSLLKSRIFHQVDKEKNSQEILHECSSASDQEISQTISVDSTDCKIPPDPPSLKDDGTVQTNVEMKILSSEPLPETLIFEKNKAVKLITVIDSGGQPEYIHMLPAISNWPTINFVVLDMTKSLDDPVMVRYKSKYNKQSITESDYPLQYSNLKMIELLMSLTHDSLKQPTEETTTNFVPTTSYVGFVGTHKDKLQKGETITRINDRLTSLIEEGNFEFTVLRGTDRYLFPVNNTTAGDDNEDPVVQSLRETIEDVIDESKPTSNQLPITWMILELELQELQISGTRYILYEEYKRIATEKASMVPEEVQESLEHFVFLGVLLHFKKVSGLSDYVIIDHQWLFNNLAMIMHLSPDDMKFRGAKFEKSFRQNRLLVKNQSHIKYWCIKEWKDELHPECFFDLLVYLNVFATAILNEVEYYYIPCVRSSTMQYHDKYIFLYSEPLLVQFSSGSLPRGFFCSLVVHLLQKLPCGWDPQLHDTEHFSNVITFQLPDKSFLRLHDKISYLEVQVRHYKADFSTSYNSQILPELSQYFKDVCTKLHLNHENLQYGFLCRDGKSNDDHIAIISPFEFPLPSELKCCRKCPHTTQLNEFHKIWFKKSTCSCMLTLVEQRETVLPQMVGESLQQFSGTSSLETTPKMKELNHYITDMSPHYYDIGLELGIPNNTLKAIKNNPALDKRERCREMLQIWLDNDTHATWKKLCDALMEYDQSVLAEKIKEAIISTLA